MQRARQAGYAALVVTIDTAVAGMRERDFRNGSKELVTRRIGPMLPFLPQFLARPRWLGRFLQDGGMMKFPNIILPDGGPMLYADVGAALEKSVVTWQDFAWIREAWGGPIIIKGVHTGEDARRAVDVGADAIVVSNHGGRQLDGVSATLRMLPEVLAAVNGRAEVLMDGGIRRGSDIVKALCLGARAVLVGRAYAYGLAARGHDGVAQIGGHDQVAEAQRREQRLAEAADVDDAPAGVEALQAGHRPRAVVEAAVVVVLDDPRRGAARRDRGLAQVGRDDDVAETQRREQRLAEAADVDDAAARIEPLQAGQRPRAVVVAAVVLVFHAPRPRSARPRQQRQPPRQRQRHAHRVLV
jgi:hypothetical protein